MVESNKDVFSYLTNIGSAYYISGSMLSTRDTKNELWALTSLSLSSSGEALKKKKVNRKNKISSDCDVIEGKVLQQNGLT